MTRPALAPAPHGQSMTGRRRQVALQWHVRCEDHTTADLIALAAPEVPELLERLRVDQLSDPAWSVRDSDGETFLEALVDVIPQLRGRNRTAAS